MNYHFKTLWASRSKLLCFNFRVKYNVFFKGCNINYRNTKMHIEIVKLIIKHTLKEKLKGSTWEKEGDLVVVYGQLPSADKHI